MIVDTEKVLREADGSVKLVAVRPHTDGKVFAAGCASNPDGESREDPEEHKRKQGRRAVQFILHHYGHLSSEKCWNWRQNTKNTKVVLYSVVIL